MKLFLLSVFFPLAITAQSFAEAKWPSTRKLIEAIKKDDIKPVRDYIDLHGNPNKVIEASRNIVTGDTLLHYAAACGSKKVVDLLLNSGADPLQMNSSMEYPIEAAVRNNNKDIIKLLARPEDKRNTEEITTELLYRIQAEGYLSRYGTPIYVSIDDKDPSEKQMKRLRALCKQFVPYSKNLVDSDEHSKKARSEKSEITILNISRKPSANGVSFNWCITIGVVGTLSGWGHVGSFSQQYGYWIKGTTRSWVS